MRKVLNRFYRWCGILASTFIVLICVIVLIQVAFNLLDKITEFASGTAYGFVLPSYSEFAGYFLAASMSLALADALQSGSHIRVTLVTQRMSAFQLWLSELFANFVGMALCAIFAFWSFNLVYESFRFNDLSPGIIPVPLWIPQLTMAIGVSALAICFADQLACAVKSGRHREPKKQEARVK